MTSFETAHVDYGLSVHRPAESAGLAAFSKVFDGESVVHYAKTKKISLFLP